MIYILRYHYIRIIEYILACVKNVSIYGNFLGKSHAAVEDLSPIRTAGACWRNRKIRKACIEKCRKKVPALPQPSLKEPGWLKHHHQGRRFWGRGGET